MFFFLFLVFFLWGMAHCSKEQKDALDFRPRNLSITKVIGIIS